MGKSLVIVESPAKARTIEGYLGSGYAVGSSVGHVRDLPDRAKDVPEAQRKRFGALGVDVDDGFEPYYVVDPGKKKIIADLKKRLAERRRAPARDGRGPRRRGDRLASRRRS